MIDFNVAMDIETAGLNPWQDRVVTVAFVTDGGDDFTVFDDPDNESWVLRASHSFIRGRRLLDPGLLIGWNHTEFDLPFLAVRMALNGLGDRAPYLASTKTIGKYGKLRYRGSWEAFGFRDLAYEYADWAKEHEVKWSLKPVAEAAKLGKVAVEVDFETGSIFDLDHEQRQLYCVTDAQMVMALFQDREKRPEEQGVLPGARLSIP